MKARLSIIIGIIVILTVSTIFFSIAYNQEIKLATGIMGTTDCRHDELKYNDKCIKLDIPEHIGSFVYGTDSIVAFCENIPTPQHSGMGLDRCIDIEYVDLDELMKKIQTNSTIPLSWPSSKYLSWCADKFDSIKYDFFENYDGCDTPDCLAEPPLFSSALNSDEDFIEKGCAKFVDKWAYLTEDNDFTWDSVYWESFVKHNYENNPISDPQRNEKCAELFDLIYLGGKDSDLWYELTETNDFRDAKCASIVGEWDQLTEHNVWNIGISWKNVAENALYGCDQNEVYYSGVCVTLETKEKAQSIGEKENEK